MQSNTIKLLLTLGIIGSIVVGIGEYLLHFLPDGPPGEISMLEYVPLERASKGHFLSIIGIPFYFAGYYGLKEFFKQASNTSLAHLLYILGNLAFIFGGIWISSRYFGAVVLQTSQNTADYFFYLESYESHYQILVWALRIIILCLSIVYILLILKNQSGLPKWLIFVNPIFLLIAVISSLFWLKPLGIHIAPIAMNTTHFIFFSIILWVANRRLG